ncbi:MAG: hypothetical protein ATN36_01435 [Epulopiscium sp. Nele67-Bin005]|nr:MAG: hypothetical protein ATN36_01435 [Epulopiscium sp. Nele67-Bin005]
MNVYYSEKDIQKLIFDEQIYKAKAILDRTKNHDASWHYLTALLAYKQSWFDTAKKHIEIARTMAPGNGVYENFHLKLVGRNQQYKAHAPHPPQNGRPNNQHHHHHHHHHHRNSGGCCDCCDCCACRLSCCDLICLDSMCECMGGDLIKCI